MILTNVGIPMIAFAWSGMIYLIIPVILIEYAVSCWLLRRDSVFERLASLTLANVVTTLFGWGLVWFLLHVCVVSWPFRSADVSQPIHAFLAILSNSIWIPPYSSYETAGIGWLLTLGMAILLIPFFFTSVFLERWILYLCMPQTPRSEIRRFSWWCHFWSYLFLYVMDFLMPFI